MKYLIAGILLFINSYCVFGRSETDSLLEELNKAIGNTEKYDAQKIKNIENIRKTFRASTSDLNGQYDFFLKLYNEYKIFNFDSAFIYSKKLEQVANTLKVEAKIHSSKIKQAFILLSAGMFKETSDVLKEINTRQLSDEAKAEYYTITARYYYDLADYNSDSFYSPAYTTKGNQYLDSALALLPSNSFEHYFFRGLKYLKQGEIEKALADYETLNHRSNLSLHETALVTSTLSNIHSRKKETKEAIDYQIRAAIADIKSSTKETFAIFNLSELLFEQGDLERSSVYIEKAVEDASFYGARLRKVQVSAILPIIQGKKINYVESQRKLWIAYAVVATIFLVLLAYLIVTINRQNKNLKRAKRIITEAHSNLHESNSKLLEATRIKEEYIGYFFNINSDFFQKITRFKKLVEQKILDRRYEDIRSLVNNIDVKHEKEELLKSFDKVFLKLFPGFVEEFNALLKEEDRIKLKDNEYLNTDLRIFALMRMGISDNEKIAQILEYSVNTIYTYKTKIKNKALVPKDEFEKRVMEIKS